MQTNFNIVFISIYSMSQRPRNLISLCDDTSLLLMFFYLFKIKEAKSHGMMGPMTCFNNDSVMILK